MVYAVVDTVVC